MRETHVVRSDTDKATHLYVSFAKPSLPKNLYSKSLDELSFLSY